MEQFENNYITQLNGAINDSVTTLTIDAAPVNMTGDFRVLIDNELIYVGTVNGLDFEDCVRGGGYYGCCSWRQRYNYTHSNSRRFRDSYHR